MKIIKFVFCICFAALTISCNHNFTISDGVYITNWNSDIYKKTKQDTLIVKRKNVKIFYSHGLSSGWREGKIINSYIITNELGSEYFKEMDRMLGREEGDYLDTLNISKVKKEKIILNNNYVFYKVATSKKNP